MENRKRKQLKITELKNIISEVKKKSLDQYMVHIDVSQYGADDSALY